MPTKPRIGQRSSPPEPKEAVSVPLPPKLLRENRMIVLEALKGLVAHAMTVRDTLNAREERLGHKAIGDTIHNIKCEIDRIVPHPQITAYMHGEVRESPHTDVCVDSLGAVEVERCYDNHKRNTRKTLCPWEPADADLIISGVRTATANLFADTGDNDLDLAEAMLWLELHEGDTIGDIFFHNPPEEE